MDTKKKKIIALSTGGVIAASIVLSLVFGGDKVPDLSNKNPEEIREYIRSEEFQSLDRDQRRQVARKSFEPFRQQFQQDMYDRARKYAVLPRQEKKPYLDQAINEMQQRFKERQAQSSGQEAGGGGGIRQAGDSARGPRQGDGRGSGEGRRDPSPERMRGRMEKMDPQQRAYMTQFKEDMNKRMEERGIEMPLGRGGR